MGIIISFLSPTVLSQLLQFPVVVCGCVPIQLFIALDAGLHTEPCTGDPEGQLVQTLRSKSITQTLNAIPDALGRREATLWSGRECSLSTGALRSTHLVKETRHLQPWT